LKIKRAANLAALFLSPLFLVRQRPFGGLLGQLPEGLGEVLSIVQEEDPPRAPLHQERDQRRICLGCVTIPARKHQVIGPVVGRLTPSGPNVVERDGLVARLRPAVRADGAVQTK
jgi:hypothetical protein